jgi:hypothetical protein
MTEYQPHPIAMLFPAMTKDEFDDLKRDMQNRSDNGLPPLEHPILLYQGKIIDGRHRYNAWGELGFEGDPPVESFSPETHDTLTAWMRAKSLNMVHRYIPADQKVAVFLKAVEAFPELKAALEEIESGNRKRQVEGKPLDASDQRGNTAKQVGKLTGVGPTTVKLVKKVKKEAPDKFEQIVQGKLTAKKALKVNKKQQTKGVIAATDLHQDCGGWSGLEIGRERLARDRPGLTLRKADTNLGDGRA